MQRRHFETIAGIINGLHMLTPRKEALAESFARKLSNTNSNFDWDRFMTACMTGKMGKGRSHKNVA